VAGITGGSFPTTPHAAVPASADAGTFIAKFSPDGGRLEYSTYLPGYFISALAVDAGGNVYLAGTTGHARLPCLRGQTQRGRVGIPLQHAVGRQRPGLRHRAGAGCPP